MARLSPQHAEKREAALRANLMRRKEQSRARVDESIEKTLPMESRIDTVQSHTGEKKD